MAKRYVTVPIPAVVAGATVPAAGIKTFDDAKARKLTGFKSSAITKQLTANLDVAGRVFATIDLGVLNTAEGFVELDQDFKVGIPFSVTFISAPTGGGANAGNTDNVVLRYEAASDV